MMSINVINWIHLKTKVYSLQPTSESVNTKLRSLFLKMSTNVTYLIIPKEHSRTEYKDRASFLNPARRSPPTAHHSPTIYGNYMKKIKNTHLNGK